MGQKKNNNHGDAGAQSAATQGLAVVENARRMVWPEPIHRLGAGGGLVGAITLSLSWLTANVFGQALCQIFGATDLAAALADLQAKTFIFVGFGLFGLAVLFHVVNELTKICNTAAKVSAGVVSFNVLAHVVGLASLDVGVAAFNNISGLADKMNGIHPVLTPTTFVFAGLMLMVGLLLALCDTPKFCKEPLFHAALADKLFLVALGVNMVAKEVFEGYGNNLVLNKSVEFVLMLGLTVSNAAVTHYQAKSPDGIRMLCDRPEASRAGARANSKAAFVGGRQNNQKMLEEGLLDVLQHGMNDIPPADLLEGALGI